MKIGIASREDDERLLKMLDLRAQGYPMPVIGARFGVTRSRVDQLTGGVLKADLRESGEPVAEVMEHYWTPRMAPG